MEEYEVHCHLISAISRPLLTREAISACVFGVDTDSGAEEIHTRL